MSIETAKAALHQALTLLRDEPEVQPITAQALADRLNKLRSIAKDGIREALALLDAAPEAVKVPEGWAPELAEIAARPEVRAEVLRLNAALAAAHGERIVKGATKGGSEGACKTLLGDRAQTVDAVIAQVMARFSTDSKEYYEAVHQRLAPLARELEADNIRLRAALHAETARWEDAVKMTWGMVDPLRQAGTPGSYARGQDSGIEAALKTLRANLKPPTEKL